MVCSSSGASLGYTDVHLPETVELLQALRTFIPGTG